MNTQTPISNEAVVTMVNRVLVDIFEVSESKLRPEALLGRDLGLDSLDGVDLVVALEKTFKCRIGEEEAHSILTLQDIYQRVIARLQAGKSGT